MNEIFKGDPAIVRSGKILPRYTERVQNAAIIPYSKSSYMIGMRYWIVITNNIYHNLNERAIIRLDTYCNYTEADHRLYKLSDGRVLMSGTAMVKFRDKGTKGDTKIGIKYITSKMNRGNVTYDHSPLSILILKSDFESNSMTIHKNWGPMIYKGKLLFIESVNPLNIVEIVDPKPVKRIYLGSDHMMQLVSPISTTDCLGGEFWTFGQYRGGTPAMLVRGQYLAFHHTRGRSKISTLSSNVYVFGAYTFTATMPFKITSLSPRPITHEIFQIDESRSVVFPLVFYLDDGNGNEIPEGNSEPNPNKTLVVLTLGINDIDTAIIKISLDTLLRSMKKVECDDSSSENKESEKVSKDKSKKPDDRNRNKEIH